MGYHTSARQDLYVKINKNDARDAEAIREAVSQPQMRFVPIKSVAGPAGGADDASRRPTAMIDVADYKVCRVSAR